MARWFWLLVGLVALFSCADIAASVVTDGWWFGSLGLGDVFRRVLVVQVGAGVLAAGIALIVVGGSARLAARSRRAPRLRSVGFDPMRIASVAVTALIAVASGVGAARSWPLVAQAIQGGTFGWADPVFGLDAGFYIFRLPLLLRFGQWAFALTIAAALVSLATYVGSGTVRVQLVQQDGQLVATGLVIPREVKAHVAWLCAALLVWYGVLSFFERYDLLARPGPVMVGPTYADLHGTMPMLMVQFIGSLVAAGFAVRAVRRSSAFGLLGAFGLVVGLRLLTALVPTVLQYAVVGPAELSLETPQIERHIAATRQAWDLSTIAEEPLSGNVALTRADVEANRDTVDNVALWDHAPLLRALGPLQEIRSYYRFVSVDQDRYVIDGRLRQVEIAPRELDVEGLAEPARTWVNRTMIYTHGYGAVVAAANEVTPQGLPELLVQDVPPRVAAGVEREALVIRRPEIYFGELAREPVVIGTRNAEFDYTNGESKQFTRYEGQEGVAVGGMFARLAFALRLSSPKLVLSRDLSPASRVLLYRNVRDRVSRIAPMFRYDRDPYLVVDQGRLVWMLDGYTTSERFPYAAHVDKLGSYARSSLKVTVDAYDGHVHFYRVNNHDPIADLWMEMFPDLFEPLDRMPATLRAHLRYPQDLFAARAELFGTFHMEDAQQFYMREDAWHVPVLGTKGEPAPMRPFYTIMELPGQETGPEFILMLPFTPVKKPNLMSWMVARSDGDYYGELVAYVFPKDSSVLGPATVDANIEADGEVSQQKSLWNQGGSRVVFGPLLVIPVEASLLYVRAMYLVKDDARSGIPELKRVIVAHQGQIAMAPTLDGALGELFAPEAAPAAPSSDGTIAPAVTTGELIRRATVHWKAADAAAQRGDWSTFGAQMDALGEVMVLLERTTKP